MTTTTYTIPTSGLLANLDAAVANVNSTTVALTTRADNDHAQVIALYATLQAAAAASANAISASSASIAIGGVTLNGAVLSVDQTKSVGTVSLTIGGVVLSGSVVTIIT